MNILVTGSAGFIASKVAEKLLSQGHHVIGVDNMNDYYDVRIKEHRNSILLKNPKYHFHKIDIEDAVKLEELFKNSEISTIFNLAARAGVRYSLVNPYVYLSTNTTATLNLLEMMRKFEVQKMVMASTSSLYSGHPMPFTEDMPVNLPISPYAASKKAAELLCYTYHFQYNVDISIVRYFTVYGPAGRPDMSIFRFIRWIDEEKPLHVTGDGTQSRDFTFVDDIAEGTILASKKIGYEIFNLGGGQEPKSLLYVIETLGKMLGKKPVLEFEPFPKADIYETSAEIGKAKNVLGWKPSINLEEGLQKAVNWYLENKSWIVNLIE